MRNVVLLVGLTLATIGVALAWGARDGNGQEGEQDIPVAAPGPAAEVPPSFTLPAEEAVARELAPAEVSATELAEPPATPGFEPTLSSTKPRIVGRVLQPDGITPAVGAGVSLDDACFMPYDDASQTTDAEGRFVFEPDAGRPFSDAELLVLAADESAWSMRPGIAGDGVTDVDLGDIVLEVVRSLRLHVQDAAGRPVGDAYAHLFGAFQDTSKPSGYDGELLLEVVPKSCTTVELWAVGFVRTRVELPEPLPTTPMTVELVACPTLVLHVNGANGGRPEGLVVRLGSTEEMFASPTGASDDDWWRRIPRRAGISEPMALSRPEGRDGGPQASVTCFYQAFAGEPVVVNELRPGVQLELSLLDPGGATAWGPMSLVLAPEERRELTLEPASTARRVQIRVRDPSGKPVSGGWVTLSSGGLGLSDDMAFVADGLATFENVVMARGEIAVHCSPWARAVWHDIDLQGAGPIDLTVQPGSELAVSLVDDSGHPAKADLILVEVDGYAFPVVLSSPEPDRRSRFELDALPPGPVRLRIINGNAHVDHDIDTRDIDLTLLVPWSDPGD